MEYASTGSWSSGTSHGASSSRHPRATSSNSVSDSTTMVDHKKLNFDQAMLDFQTMFPHADKEVIEQVLRANSGAVEQTIDQLLALSSSQKQDALFVNTDQRKASGTLRKISRWKPALLGPLPSDFLRISTPRSVWMATPNDQEPPRATHNAGAVIKIPKRNSLPVAAGAAKSSGLVLSKSPETPRGNDENLTSCLQNEDFLRELQQDEEFLTALQKDAKVGSCRDNSGFLPPSDVMSPSSNKTSEDPSEFQNKLKKNMGLLSKERLNLFSKQFSRKKKSPKAVVSKSTPSSYDHLIEDNHSLVSDDDDVDDHLAEGSAHVRLEKKASQYQ